MLTPLIAVVNADGAFLTMLAEVLRDERDEARVLHDHQHGFDHVKPFDLEAFLVMVWTDAPLTKEREA